MCTPRILLAPALFGLLAVSVFGQSEATETISLSQAVSQALKAGDDVAILQANLQASQAANALAQAKNGFTVGTSLSYGASEASNSPGVKVNSMPNPYTNSQVASSTAAVGSATTDGILVQNPKVTVTAGTPLTSLSGSWSTGIQTWPDGSSRNVSTASAALSQTIWNGYWGGPTQAAADKASLSYQSAQLTAQASRNKTVLAVKQAFYTLLSAQENLTLLQTTLESRKTTLAFVQAKYSLRQATDVDLLTAQVNEKTSELDLVDGQNTLATARQRLANLLGLPTEHLFTASQEPDPPAPATSLDEAVALGLKNRTDLQIANLNARSAQVDQTLAMGSLVPSVAVTGGVTSLTDNTASKSVLVGQVGVTLGAALWDAGAGSSQISQAERTRTAYLTQVHQLERSIPVDIKEAWNTWQQALKRLELARVNVQNYDLQLKVTKLQLDAGTKTLTDQFTAEINASTAAFGLLKAKITAQLAALQLQSLLGL